MKTNLTTLALILPAIICASCASTKNTTWLNPEYKGGQINNVVVICASKSDADTREFEDMFTEQLSKAGITATQGYTFLPTEGTLSEKELTAAITEKGIPSAIVTRVLSQKEKVYTSPSVYPAYYGRFHGYYGHARGYMYSGDQRTYVESQIEANLYDVASGDLIWSSNQQITDFDSKKKNMKKVTSSITKGLKKINLAESP